MTLNRHCLFFLRYQFSLLPFLTIFSSSFPVSPHPSLLSYSLSHSHPHPRISIPFHLHFNYRPTSSPSPLHQECPPPIQVLPISCCLPFPALLLLLLSFTTDTHPSTSIHMCPPFTYTKLYISLHIPPPPSASTCTPHTRKALRKPHDTRRDGFYQKVGLVVFCFHHISRQHYKGAPCTYPQRSMFLSSFPALSNK